MITASRLLRYAIFLAGYDFKIQFVTSEKNSADVLSRLLVDSSKETKVEKSYLHCVDEFKVMNAELIQKETGRDSLLNKIKYYIVQGWPESVEDNLKVYKNKQELLSVEQNVVLYGHKIIIPENLQKSILEELHLNHLGVVKMKSIARNHVWWPNIDKDIEEIAKNCIICAEQRPMPKKSRLHMWNGRRVLGKGSMLTT